MDTLKDLRKKDRTQAAAFLANVVAGGYPTQEVLYRDRRVLSPNCLVCDSAIGTPKHRLFECEGSTMFRRDLDMDHCVTRGRGLPDFDFLTTRALTADPGYDWRQPGLDPVVCWEKRVHSGFLEPFICIDISGLDEGSAYGERAGWSAVAMDPRTSVVTGSIFGPLPPPDPGGGGRRGLCATAGFGAC